MAENDSNHEGIKAGKASFPEWIKAFLTAGLVLAFFKFVQSAGWLGNFGVQDAKLTLGISILIGFAASLSSCLAVVGGIVIAFSEKYSGGESDNFWAGSVWPNVKFHIGRILTFFALGGALGLIGGKISLGGNFVSAYTIIIAFVMAWLGLNILGILPSISALGIRPPKSFTKYLVRTEKSEHGAAPFILGGLTFFLPCGFTQSMQILSLASGSFWAGAGNLFFFALGTAPVLLALGMAASWARFEKISFLNKAAGILVILFAAYTFNSGLALLSTNKLANKEIIKANGKANISEDNSAVSTNAMQKVEMKITSRGFEPSLLKVKSNIPVQFAINGDGATGCTNRIVIPDLGIEKDIKKGENIIEFTPKKIGPIAYSCWMGMVRGKIIVE